ncbi:S8 family serine peptidase [Dactylosporangium sp. NPDC000521]|uniref:S8 family serine peptidase n=1 Tax=Dactylosporangium sp. NPDC000521 TaxID=3363975 RepID=UPI0036B574A9
MGRSRGWALGLTIVLGLWAVAVTIAVHAGVWVVGEGLLALGFNLPRFVWPAAGWLAAALVAGPSLLLARLSRVAFAQVAGRQWALTALLGGLLGTARIIPTTAHEGYLALLAVIAAIAATVHRVVRWRAPRSTGWLFWLCLTIGLIALLPWLWVGAFGSRAETLLAALAAVAIAWLAMRPAIALVTLGASIHSVWGGTALGGLTAGVGLVTLVAGAGEPAVQLFAMVAVPPLAFALAALARRGRPSVLALLAPVLFGPLALVDPEETSLLLGLRDVAFWSAIGALAGLVLALAAAAAAVPATGRIRWRPGFAALAAVVVLAGGATVYAALGQPGFHGEQLFVIMKEQADLNGLRDVPDRTTRIRQTYERLVGTAERSQASLRGALRSRGIDFTPFYLVNGIEVDAGPLARRWLEGRPEVDRVLLNPRLRPLPAVAAPMRGTLSAPTAPPWNLTLIKADQVWSQFTTGRGIVVGSSDSGVDANHPALRTTFRGSDDSWLDPVTHTATPADHNGHGTHTLATAVGAGVGVAPGAQWIACSNLPRNLGSMTNYLGCLQFMMAPYPPGTDPMHAGRPDRAPQVLTNSWGCPSVEGCDTRSLRHAVDAFAAAGIFFVAAAGNTGPGCATVTDPPANYASTFTVGAVTSTSRVASFSSRGPTPDNLPKPDLMAPGAGVVSALPGGGYGALSGTSMATPHVAGVVALMWAANPALIGHIEQTRAILLRTTQPVDTSTSTCGPSDTAGAGLVDALAAVTAATATRPALRP